MKTMTTKSKPTRAGVRTRWLRWCRNGILGVLAAAALAGRASDLEKGFADPPNGARLRAYWWWLNGNVTKAAITRDLEEMKAKGFGGAVIFDWNAKTLGLTPGKWAVQAVAVQITHFGVH